MPHPTNSHLHNFNIHQIAMISLPTLSCGTRISLVSTSTQHLVVPQARNSYNPIVSNKNVPKRTRNYQSRFLNQPLSTDPTSFSLGDRGLLSIVPSNAKNSSSGSGEEDGRALETVLKLYTAIKNQNIKELSDIIGDECRCVCNFFSFFQPFQGKQQVLDFFNYLIKFLGNHFEFVVQPTMHDGLNVGVSWRLNWSKTHVPLGKGFSFYILQVYQGRVVIRNVEMFMEPLLHLEPFRLKMMGYARGMIDMVSSFKLSKDKVKKAVLLLFLLAIILLFLKPGLY